MLFVLHRVGKMLKSIKIYLKCPVFNALGAAVSRPQSVADVGLGGAPKGPSPGLGVGVNAFVCGVSRLQGVKIREDLLKMRSFQCIGGGSVPPPISCRTLGRVARRKAHRLALAEA